MQAATADAIDAVESSVNVLFGRAKLLWREAAAQVHPELQPAGYKLLAHLVRTGGSTAHLLAELFEMDKSVVSRQVGRLEEFGLAESRIDEHDGRIRRLSATPAGVESVRRVRDLHHERLRSALEEFSPDELVTCARVLGCLAEV
ncbi:MarR family winged helix-turn-helix transcriptional regulator [Agromyces seonyuensis]|uniref:MarR family transcriptional regulator n=1 Tax=Agromyces seonyuensis TaxID=2662446 RepID=A0A6I4NTL8_9MICO|nr:MarR family winged helix-turn-helix transcriptional regulator [Agromyces seonyuensis]MWB97610.1 MarR family transcriptional regulator [Agromyces seonyuensis]